MKKTSTVNSDAIIAQSMARVRRHLRRIGWQRHSSHGDVCSNADCRMLLARYAAGVAGEFQAWLGITYAFARSENAQYALKNNLRCELGQDHIGMLYKFVGQVGAYPNQEHRRCVEEKIFRLRILFGDIVNVGLSGVTVLAVLESTSQLFIPVLASTARHLGATDFTYTNVHGEADAKHSDAFVGAIAAEAEEGYENPGAIVSDAAAITTDYITALFSDVL